MSRPGTSGKEQSRSEDRVSRVQACAAIALSRLVVQRRVPIEARGRLQRDLLLRPKGCETLEAIAERHKLAERYGISMQALRVYSRRLEALVRPVLGSHIVSGILGCLPKAYRMQVAEGTQILLISHLLAALQGEGQERNISDLVRLSTILSSAAARLAGSAGKGKDISGETAPEWVRPLAREFYGVELQPSPRSGRPTPSQTGTNIMETGSPQK